MMAQAIDIEAENRAIELKTLDVALDKDAKKELDSRLKKAAEEAKAKGKKTIRTFDMLRKAISGGDPEQRKKEDAERKKKAEEEVAEAEKLKQELADEKS